MKNLIVRDKSKRILVERYELHRKMLKSIIYNQALDNKLRFAAQKELSQLPKNSCYIRVRNRCVLTGRSKSVYRKFRLSRIMLRNTILNGLIPGATKASW
jgi:small subunit ribosomal protein S14